MSRWKPEPLTKPRGGVRAGYKLYRYLNWGHVSTFKAKDNRRVPAHN